MLFIRHIFFRECTKKQCRYRTYPVPFFFVVLFLSFGSMGSQMLLQTQHTNTCNSLSIYNQSKHQIGRNTTFQIITIRPTNLHKSLTPHKKNDCITMMIITSNNQVPEQNSNKQQRQCIFDCVCMGALLNDPC